MRNIHKNVPMLFEPFEWKVEEKNFVEGTNSINETIFCIGNGYLGIRGFFEEGFYGASMHTMRTTMINGIYEYFPYNHIWCRPGFPKRYHSILNQTDPFDIKIYIDDELVILGDNVTNYNRTLYLRSGEVVRKFTYKTKTGKNVNLVYKRFCSQTDRHIAFGSIDVLCESTCNVRLVSSLASIAKKEETVKEEIGGSTGEVYNFREVHRDEHNMVVGYNTKTSGFEVTCGVSEKLDVLAKKNVLDTEDTLITEYVLDEFNGSFHYERGIVFTTNREFNNHFEVALEKLNSTYEEGYQAYLEETIKKWDEFWDYCDVEINSDVAVTQGIRFSMFHIYQSTGKDGITNISANGLTGTGYSGHTFWDTEIFMMPMYIYTAPEIAKQLIMYRYNILPNAKKRAKEMDDVGALFAWNSINGEECGHVFEAVTAQYHINPDIFYAIKQYYEATDDVDFMVNYCAEILFEMSKCLSHRGNFIPLKDNKFCINCICGPDEYNPIVDNNLYTNLMTKKMFEFTLEIKDLLEKNYPEKYNELLVKTEMNDEEFERIKLASENMYLAYSEELDIYMQDDNFFYKDPIDIENIPLNKLPLLTNLHPLNLWRYQVCKQADIILLMFLQSQEFTPEMRKKVFDFYEPKTIHDSSLSAGIHSIVACDIGYQDEAYQYLKQSCRMDLDNVNRNTYFGIHAACMGTSWMMVVNGYGGLRVYDNMLHFNPFCAKEWQSLSFKITFKGATIKTTVSKDEVVYELLTGEKLDFYHKDELISLTNGEKRCI